MNLNHIPFRTYRLADVDSTLLLYLPETRIGFEPMNNSFANYPFKPLRHRVVVGADGAAPPEVLTNRFTVYPATTYGIYSH